MFGIEAHLSAFGDGLRFFAFMYKPLERAKLLSPVQQQWMSLRDDPLVCTREAAALLGTSLYSLRRWLKLGRLRSCRVAGRIKIRQSEVLKLIYEGNENRCPENVNAANQNT